MAEAARRRRARRAADDPVGLRARRHHRPRGDGAAHRGRLDRAARKTVPQALALALRSGFSRIPVVGENVDDVVGVVYLKDLARRAQDAERARDHAGRRGHARRPPSSPSPSRSTSCCARCRPRARTSRSSSTSTAARPAWSPSRTSSRRSSARSPTSTTSSAPPVERIDDDTARVTARLAVEDLAELFDVELPDRDDVETVGGLLAEALGRVPIAGRDAQSCTAWS